MNQKPYRRRFTAAHDPPALPPSLRPLVPHARRNRSASLMETKTVSKSTNQHSPLTALYHSLSSGSASYSVYQPSTPPHRCPGPKLSGLYHNSHFFFGFIPVPTGQLKAWENGLKLLSTPRTRYLAGECSSESSESMAMS